MVRTIVITGASGFLGQALLDAAANLSPTATVVPIRSPRHGGIDLTRPDASEVMAQVVQISNPETAVLIHAAAAVSWNTSEGLLANAAMALNVANWARSADIGFSVLTSSVNVFPILPSAGINVPSEPQTLYGLGKLAAEHVWRLVLPQERNSTVRLAGIWGWQQRPSLFWNHLLLAAALGSPSERAPVVRRNRSLRNYVSVLEASECLLQVALNRMTGLFLAAGRDAVDTQTYVEALQSLQGSRLSVDWRDDGGTDKQLFHPSVELIPWLRSFSQTLSTVWDNKPPWVCQSV